MRINKGVLRTNHFYVDHVKPEDVVEIKNFRVDAVEGQGLIDYLKGYALLDETAREMRTYLVRFDKTDECAGYFSLKAGLISLNEIEVEVIDDQTGEKRIGREFDTLPGVELADFAVNSAFIEKYPTMKGIGQFIFKEFVLPVTLEAGRYIGVKMIYIFALPYDSLIARYEAYGFRRLPETEENDLHRRLKPRYDESCKFMYLLLP